MNMDIISAFAENKTIQYRIATGVWCDLTEREGLPMGILEEIPDIFRIKPELKYRPFANAEECWAEMKKHEPFGWIIGLLEGGTHFLIICVRNDNYPITCNGGHTIFLPFDKLCNCYTFADGTPFGIKEK